MKLGTRQVTEIIPRPRSLSSHMRPCIVECKAFRVFGIYEGNCYVELVDRNTDPFPDWVQRTQCRLARLSVDHAFILQRYSSVFPTICQINRHYLLTTALILGFRSRARILPRTLRMCDGAAKCCDRLPSPATARDSSYTMPTTEARVRAV